MFNVEEQTEKVIDWTRNWMNEKGEDSKAIIGISGGIDSSTVAAILEKAIGKERIIAIKLPCGVQKDIDYSNKLIEHLGLTSFEINIGEAYNLLTKEIRKVSKNGETFPCSAYSTNTPARLRMTTLFGVAAIVGNGYVAGTGNLTEDVVGYSTFYGDGAASFDPILLFTKKEVIEIAKYLGLPKELYEKTPIDGMSLNDDGSYKSDEQKLGFTYEEVGNTIRTGNRGEHYDKILNMFNKNKFKNEIVKLPHYEPNLPISSEFRF